MSRNSPVRCTASRPRPVRSFLHACLISALLAGSAHAATYTVTTNGGGAGTPCTPAGADFTCDTLHAALAAANATADDDIIEFDAAVAGDILLEDTLQVVAAATGGALTLQGRLDGADQPEIRLHGGDARRVLFVQADADVIVHSLAIVHGLHAGVAPGGGGIMNEGTLRIESSVVSNNTADVGGGIYNHFGPLTIVNSTLADNTSAGDGGGLYINAGDVEIQGSMLASNRATDNGGGIYSGGNWLHIDDSTLSLNSADNGAGIHFAATWMRIENSTLSRNEAANEGGGLFTGSGDVEILSSTLADNRAVEGGGIYNMGAAVEVHDSTVSGNAAENGGGSFNRVAAELYFQRSTLTGNTANVGSGGAITSGGLLILSHSTLSGNTAATLGGGFYNSGTTEVYFSTITNNTTDSNDGGGFSTGQGTVTLTATVVANNTDDCELGGGGITATNSFFGDDPNTCFNTDGGGNLTGDPVLGPLADNGGPTLTHFPQAGSPLIDTAGGACAGNDQRGVARPQGAACDIGAVEVAQFTLVVNVTGDGSVTADPLAGGGINACAGNCQQDYAEGTSVELTATADAGWQFSAWDGDCVGQPNPATVVMDGDYACQAIFIAAPAVAMLAIQGGDAQSTDVFAAFGNALSVLVTDAADAPVAGVVVDFAAVPAGNGATAALSAPNAVTGADGVASVNATANGIAGNYTVTASLPAYPAIDAVNFALANIALDTTLVLIVDPVLVAPNGTITLTATLAPAVLGAVVDFLVDGNIVCAAVPVDAAGVAQCVNVGPFGPGPHQAQATYAGDPGHHPSNGAAPFNVQGAAPVTVPVDSLWALGLLIALMSLVGLVLVPRPRG